MADVTIFEHVQFQGRQQLLNTGWHDLSALTLGGDTASSLRVAPGCSAIVFEHPGFQGEWRVYVRDTTRLDPSFNDRCSSVIVLGATTRPVLFQHFNFLGTSLVLEPGRLNTSDLGALGNDKISSLRVPPGWVVTLFEHANFEGRSRVCTGDVPRLDSFNDLASSLTVTAPAPFVKLESLYGELRAKTLARHYALGRYWRADCFTTQNRLGVRPPAARYWDRDQVARHSPLPGLSGADALLQAEKVALVAGALGSLTGASDQAMQAYRSLSRLRWQVVVHERENALCMTGMRLIQLSLEHRAGDAASGAVVMRTLESLARHYKFSGDFSGYPIRYDAALTDNWTLEMDQDGVEYPRVCAEFLTNPNPEKWLEQPYLYCVPLDDARYSPPDGSPPPSSELKFGLWRHAEPSMDEVAGLISGYSMVARVFRDDASTVAPLVLSEVVRQSRNLGNYLADNAYLLRRPCGNFTRVGGAGPNPALEYALDRALRQITGDASFASRNTFEQVVKNAGLVKAGDPARDRALGLDVFDEPSIAGAAAQAFDLALQLGGKPLVQALSLALGQANGTLLANTVLGALALAVAPVLNAVALAESGSGPTAARRVLGWFQVAGKLYARRAAFDSHNGNDALDDAAAEFAVAYLVSRIADPRQRFSFFMDQRSDVLENWAIGFKPFIALTALDDTDTLVSQAYLSWYDGSYGTLGAEWFDEVTGRWPGGHAPGTGGTNQADPLRGTVGSAATDLANLVRSVGNPGGLGDAIEAAGKKLSDLADVAIEQLSLRRTCAFYIAVALLLRGSQVDADKLTSVVWAAHDELAGNRLADLLMDGNIPDSPVVEYQDKNSSSLVWIGGYMLCLSLAWFHASRCLDRGASLPARLPWLSGLRVWPRPMLAAHVADAALAGEIPVPMHAARRTPFAPGPVGAGVDLFAEPRTRPVDPNVLVPNRAPLVLATPGTLTIHVLGSDDHAWQVRDNGTPPGAWGTWRLIDGGARTPIWRDLLGIAGAGGTRELVAIGHDGHLKYQHILGAGSGNWVDLGGACGRIALGRDPGGGLEVVAVGEDDHVFRIAQDPVTRVWGSWGPSLGRMKQVYLARAGAGRVAVYGIDAGGRILRRSHGAQGGAWADWADLGRKARKLAFGREAEGATEVFAILQDDGLLWNLRPAGAAGASATWQLAGGPRPMRELAAVTGNDGLITVLGIGSDRALWALREHPARGVWVDWAHVGPGGPDGQLTTLHALQMPGEQRVVTVLTLEGRVWQIRQPAAAEPWGSWTAVPYA